MKHIILNIAFFFFYVTLVSQENITIDGFVSNKNKFYLSGASVLLYSKKDTTKILDYTITNKKGKFSINTTELSQKYISISYLGYESKKVQLLQNMKYYNIILKDSENNLEEVVIRASKYRDTIRFKKDTIKFSKKTKLKDLLKANEGIEITDKNGITFMGVPINKILINKKEVFVNQNSLALENITNEMIENIQIINNYKNKFNVEFDNFDEMVINIDVKKQFKGVLKNIIELGLGIKDAYSIKINSFLFSDKINVFLTQNTNSVSDKTKNEIANRHNFSSSFYKDNITSIAQGVKNVRKDLYNNTYLLVKKEYKKSKLETNIGFNYSNQELDNLILIDENKNPISKEFIKKRREGNVFYGDFNFTNLISNNFSVSFFSNIDVVDNNFNWQNNKIIFTTSNFNSNTVYNSNNFIFKNTLNIKKIINQKWLLENSIDYVYENTDTNFYNNLNLANTSQSINYHNKQFNLSSSLFYQKSSLLNYGINVKLVNINENINSQINTNNYFVKRHFNQFKSAIILKGKNTKFNYFINIGSQLFLFESNNFNKNVFPVSSSFNYKVSSKKSFNVSYEKTYEIENLENSLDSIFINSTTLIKSKDISKNIEQKQNLTLSYNIANISKSKNISFLISGATNNNFSQFFLTDFSSNITTFQRTIFDNSKTLFLQHIYSKGYYFSKNDHKLELGYKLSSSLSKSKIIQNNILQPLSSQQFNVGVNLGLIPQKTFFTEVSLQSNIIKNNINTTDLKINSTDINKNSIFISKSNGKHIYSVEFYNEYYKTRSEKLIKNDFNVSYSFYINKETSFFIKGNNILNLLNITENAGNLIVNSTNILSITTINNNNFGYLIAGIHFKL